MNFKNEKKKNYIHENPFSCAVCKKTFGRKVGLRTHIMKTNHIIHKEWPQIIRTIIPSEGLYNVVSFCSNGIHYKMKLVLPNIASVDELHSWIDNFINLSQCVYIRTGRKMHRSSLTHYSEFYRCQHFHKQKVGKKRSKGTGCKSSITASLKCDAGTDAYYAPVIINFFHNHSISTDEVLKFRKPSVEVEKIFRRMFLDGFSPAHALRNFTTHLEFQPTEFYTNSICDRTKCPDYNWVHYFSRKLLKNIRPVVGDKETLKIINDYVESSNKQCTSEICLIEESPNHDFAISILTPLMKRGLEHAGSGETVFVDGINCVDRFGLNILLLTCVFEPTTRVPVGVIVTSAETATSLEQGFRAHLLMTDGASFGGRGRDGPVNFVSQNSKIVSKVLKKVFPKASLLWSCHHFLKTAFNWLLNSKYHVNRDDLGNLYSAIRKMAYASDESTLDECHRQTLATYSCNPQVVAYLKALYEKRQKWATCYRPARKCEFKSVLLHELQILKEEIVEQVKMQRPVALLKYFVSGYDYYFMKKLVDNCVDFNQNYFRKFANDTDAKNYTFGPFLNSQGLYYVYNRNKNTKYLVNMDVGVCTCYVGVGGSLCRHQRLLMDATNEGSMLQHPGIVEPKVELYYIATGSHEISQTFFDSLHSFDDAQEMQYALEVVLKNDGTSECCGIDDIETNLDAHVIEEIVIEVNGDTMEAEEQFEQAALMDQVSTENTR